MRRRGTSPEHEYFDPALGAELDLADAQFAGELPADRREIVQRLDRAALAQRSAATARPRRRRSPGLRRAQVRHGLVAVGALAMLGGTAALLASVGTTLSATFAGIGLCAVASGLRRADALRGERRWRSTEQLISAFVDTVARLTALFLRR